MKVSKIKNSRKNNFLSLKPVLKLRRQLPKDEILRLVEEAKGEQSIDGIYKSKKLLSRHT